MLKIWFKSVKYKLIVMLTFIISLIPILFLRFLYVYDFCLSLALSDLSFLIVF